MAYRTLISTEAFRSDPLLRDLVEKPRISCWIGPKKHVIGYCVNGGKEYNMVLLTPDDDSTNSTSDLDEARTAFADWEPRIQKLLSLTRTVMKTKLMVCAPLKTWTHPSGGVTLLGDACHPMLPYRAQGAAMAIEDAAILGNLFARLTNRAQISMLLELYEEIRHDRVAAVQMASLDNRRLFHMEDGPEQETRDLGMRIGFPGATPWSDRDKTVRLLGYDTDQVTEGWWTAHKH
ncbi:hypothetical protein MPER_11131 [Moniliophthora perniciosa FA553]|nr:hypothetical protein MPER_11131 [Moniliophthora perniciosa FA553]